MCRETCYLVLRQLKRNYFKIRQTAVSLLLPQYYITSFSAQHPGRKPIKSTFGKNDLLIYHKTLPRSSVFVNWFSVRFYEMDCIICTTLSEISLRLCWFNKKIQKHLLVIFALYTTSSYNFCFYR